MAPIIYFKLSLCMVELVNEVKSGVAYFVKCAKTLNLSYLYSKNLELVRILILNI